MIDLEHIQSGQYRQHVHCLLQGDSSCCAEEDVCADGGSIHKDGGGARHALESAVLTQVEAECGGSKANKALSSCQNNEIHKRLLF